MSSSLIILLVLTAAGLWLVGVFNSLVRSRNRVKESWSDIDVQLKRRHDLIPNLLTGALKSLFALSEAYPQLRAVESFTKLQDELADTENKIQAARRFYNTNVLSLNTRVEQFPSNIVASMFGFKKEVFFEIANAAEKEPIKVSF